MPTLATNRILRGWRMQNIIINTANSNLLGHWPLWDYPNPTNVYDSKSKLFASTYTSIGSFGNTGIGDGMTCPSFNGSTSLANVVGTSGLSAWNGQEGSMSIWLKVSANGVWTDATVRRCLYLRFDSTNLVAIQRNGNDGIISCSYVAANTTKTAISGTLTGNVGWIHAASTWSKSGDAMKFYINGVQLGGTQTGLGTFASGALTGAAIGMSSVSSGPWSGFLAHAAVWNTPLTQAQITALYAF